MPSCDVLIVVIVRMVRTPLQSSLRIIEGCTSIGAGCLLRADLATQSSNALQLPGFERAPNLSKGNYILKPMEISLTRFYSCPRTGWGL